MGLKTVGSTWYIGSESSFFGNYLLDNHFLYKQERKKRKEVSRRRYTIYTMSDLPFLISHENQQEEDCGIYAEDESRGSETLAKDESRGSRNYED